MSKAKGFEMPLFRFLSMIAAVIVLAGLTIWGFSLAGATALAIALPLLLILAVAVRWWAR